MKEHKDIFSRIEWIIFRVALIALSLIGIIKLLKVELTGLW
jgi:Flp pilus assembly pilin Flp